MTVKKTAYDLVAALRSGEFEKGQGSLKKKTSPEGPWKYCCEGVMCEISEVPVVEEKVSALRPGNIYTRFSQFPMIQPDPVGYSTSVDAFAPAFVWEGSGMPVGSNGDVAMIELPEYEKEQVYNPEADPRELHFEGWTTISLANINDYESTDEDPDIRRKNTFTFDQIADLIEWAAVRNYGNN